MDTLDTLFGAGATHNLVGNSAIILMLTLGIATLLTLWQSEGRRR